MTTHENYQEAPAPALIVEIKNGGETISIVADNGASVEGLKIASLPYVINVEGGRLSLTSPAWGLGTQVGAQAKSKPWVFWVPLAFLVALGGGALLKGCEILVEPEPTPAHTLTPH